MTPETASKMGKNGSRKTPGQGRGTGAGFRLFTIGPSKRVDALTRLRYNIFTVATAVKTAVVAGEMAKGGKTSV